MYDLVCRADTLFLAAQIRMGGMLLAGLLMTIGEIGLVFSIIFTAISLLMTSNAQKKEEKKSHALVICVAGICIFSVFSIVGFFKSIGSGL